MNSTGLEATLTVAAAFFISGQVRQQSPPAGEEAEWEG